MLRRQACGILMLCSCPQNRVKRDRFSAQSYLPNESSKSEESREPALGSAKPGFWIKGKSNSSLNISFFVATFSFVIVEQGNCSRVVWGKPVRTADGGCRTVPRGRSSPSRRAMPNGAPA